MTCLQRAVNACFLKRYQYGSHFELLKLRQGTASQSLIADAVCRLWWTGWTRLQEWRWGLIGSLWYCWSQVFESTLGVPEVVGTRDLRQRPWMPEKHGKSWIKWAQMRYPSPVKAGSQSSQIPLIFNPCH